MIGQIFNNVLLYPLLNLLVFFYNFIPDMGVIIALITVLVRLALFPSFHKSLKHQKALAQLQPKMNEIREKYKDDKEQQAKALMEPYQVHKVNPLSSCGPLLVQLPILIALYQVFIRSLNGNALVGIYSFISTPEKLNPISLGFLNLAVPNIIMAVIAGALQYVQSRMQLQKNPANDPTTKALSIQTLYVFPILTVFIGSKFPAGLALYWIVNTLFGIGQQYFILRKEAKEALYGKH
jgi:YidC/Oxa1 family membrane protein insertase